jgi:hypothetical protein
MGCAGTSDDDGDGFGSTAVVSARLRSLPAFVVFHPLTRIARPDPGWFFCPPCVYHKHRPLRLVSLNLSGKGENS